ncbi:hypothetical protein STA3757_47340 [Stanieria sp. NIES-3757]|nr:hypothetical protein STA3757_47340 [Stanieria sp. NIES-3757]
MITTKFSSIDKIAIAIILTLSLVIGGLLWSEAACETGCLFHTGPKVSHFTWENKPIGREERAFLLTFNRPMDRSSVEANLRIQPPLPGKFSWSGLRLAYTLDNPAPYGENYLISLKGAQERFPGSEQLGELIQPFKSEFYSRDRAFAYLGSQEEERGRLVLYNWTQKTKTILTPPELTVFEFEPYPQGDLILFSAAKRDLGMDAVNHLQLYTVSTEVIANQTPELKLILDHQGYQNQKFDLSQDGKIIVVQRINRKDPTDFGLWLIKERQKPEPLQNSSGGDFLIAPDSQTLAVAQGEGIALLPLQPDAEPLDFLPKFGRVVSFAPDGTAAAMVNYNTDNPKLKYTRSLFYVNNQGIQKELLNTKGSILDCQFNPNVTHLYCLLTELKQDTEYKEQPYLAEINLKTNQINPLLALPEYQDSQISMAPDGLGVLFDQILTTESGDGASLPATSSGETIVNSRLWLLLPPTESTEDSSHQLEELPLIGFHPQWLP